MKISRKIFIITAVVLIMVSITALSFATWSITSAKGNLIINVGDSAEAYADVLTSDSGLLVPYGAICQDGYKYELEYTAEVGYSKKGILNDFIFKGIDGDNGNGVPFNPALYDVKVYNSAVVVDMGNDGIPIYETKNVEIPQNGVVELQDDNIKNKRLTTINISISFVKPDPITGQYDAETLAAIEQAMSTVDGVKQPLKITINFEAARTISSVANHEFAYANVISVPSKSILMPSDAVFYNESTCTSSLDYILSVGIKDNLGSANINEFTGLKLASILGNDKNIYKITITMLNSDNVAIGAPINANSMSNIELSADKKARIKVSIEFNTEAATNDQDLANIIRDTAKSQNITIKLIFEATH